MKAKQIAVMTLIVLVCSTLSAVVAYRLAKRQVPRGLSKLADPVQPVPSGTSNSACVDFRDAGPHVGGPGCVSGRPLRVFTSRAGNTFLDFCEDYRNCPFTSVIFASDKSKFGDVGALTGRRVEIQGTITTYQGHAEIIVRDPSQIRVVP